MAAPPTDLSDRERQLDEAIAEFFEQVESGAATNAEEWICRYPRFQAELRAFFTDCDAIEDVAAPLRAVTRPDTVVDQTRRLGDFLIGQKIGRGGMGVVYEAEQISLGRRVALKVLPFAAALDQRQLQRFKNEAQAAAVLKHPHIVGVHCVGCERGVHFYAMELVEGHSVAEVIEQLRRGASQDAGATAGLPSSARDDAPEGHGLPQGKGASHLFCEAGHRPKVGRGPSRKKVADTFSHATTDTSPIAALSTEGDTKSPGYFRTVARLGIQAAEALEYAHQTGIVHRDIKPSNLMVEPGEGNEGKGVRSLLCEAGHRPKVGRGPSRQKTPDPFSRTSPHLWITDFGLAQVQTDANLTLTGDLLGTLRYMSPEQAAGRRTILDHRTDIYSLGITLYELATLRPAFGETDRAKLLHDILEHDPPAPRTVNAAVPKDLETIILKATAKEPSARYDSAQEFADDLNRYLEHQPVRAKRPTAFDRITKWSRRHRAIIRTSSTISLALLLVGTAIIWRQRSEAIARRVEAEEQTKRGDENLRDAMRVVDEMYNFFVEDDLAQMPELDEVRKRLLRKAMRFYEQFAEKNDLNPALAFDTAQASLRLADLFLELQEHEKAERALNQGFMRLEAVPADEPWSDQVQYELAHYYGNLGSLRMLHARSEEAGDCYRKALHIYGGLDPRFLELPSCRLSLAAAHSNLGLVLADTGQPDAAVDACREAVHVMERLARGSKTPRYTRQHCMYRLNLAIQLFHTEQVEEAVRVCRLAVDDQKTLAGQFPNRPGYRHHLAVGYINLHGILSELRPEELLQVGGDTEDYISKAAESLRILTTDYGDRVEFRADYALAQFELGLHLGKQQRHQKALQLLEHAEEIWNSLVEQFPERVEYRVWLAESLDHRAEILGETGQPEDAETLFLEAIDDKAQLAEEFADNAGHQARLADAYRSYGVLLLRSGKLQNAERSIRQALEIRKGHIGVYLSAGIELMGEYINLGTVLRRQERLDEAEQSYATALRLAEDLEREFAENSQYRSHRAKCYENLGAVYALQGHADDAVQYCRRGVEEHEQLVAHYADVEQFSVHLAESYSALGMAHYRAGQWKDALNALNKARALTDSDESLNTFLLALCHWRLGNLEKARQHYAQAIASLDKQSADDPVLRQFRAEAEMMIETE